MKKQTIPILLILTLFIVSCELRTLDVQGHRGARGLRPENMISGFEYAMNLNVTTIELDVAVTRDRHVIVTHNPYVHIKLCLNEDGTPIRSDTLGLGPFIRDLTLAEVLAYDCGSLNPDPSRFPEPPRVNIPGEKMPTLIEVFNLILKKFINLEIFFANFFFINSLKKVFAKRYNKTPPIVLPQTKIRVPSHLPKIKPITKVGRDMGHINTFNKIVIIKKIIVRKKMLFSLYFKIKPLFSLIKS